MPCLALGRSLPAVTEEPEEKELGVAEAEGLSDISTASSAAEAEGAPAPARAVEELGLSTRRRARTHSTFIERDDVELLVVDHSNLDNTFLAALGKHAKLMRWRVVVAGHEEAIELEVQVDKAVALAPQVRVTADGERIFPAFGSQGSAAMKEDFHHKWTFRGIPKGFHEQHRFEVRPRWRSSGEEEWFVATLTSRRMDGTYEAKVLMDDGLGEEVEVVIVGIRAEDIRERETKEPMQLQTRTLLLEVPKSAPHAATLKVLDPDSESEGLDMTHFFGRWTPDGAGAHCEADPNSTMRPVSAPGHSVSPTVRFQVGKNAAGQLTASTDVGHTVLERFVSGEVCAVSSDSSAMRKTWTIQLGPYTEHVVEIQRRSRLSNIIAVSIDGSKLVESAATNIGASVVDGIWNCNFRFVGDKFLEFKMDEAEIATLPTRFAHQCQIVMTDPMNIRDASLIIDDMYFTQLRPKVPLLPEQPISAPAEVLRRQYGIVVPHRAVASTAASMMQDQLVQSLAEATARASMMQDQLVQSLPGHWQATREAIGSFVNNITGAWSCQGPKPEEEQVDVMDLLKHDEATAVPHSSARSVILLTAMPEAWSVAV